MLYIPSRNLPAVSSTQTFGEAFASRTVKNRQGGSKDLQTAPPWRDACALKHHSLEGEESVRNPSDYPARPFANHTHCVYSTLDTDNGSVHSWFTYNGQRRMKINH